MVIMFAALIAALPELEAAAGSVVSSVQSGAQGLDFLGKVMGNTFPNIVKVAQAAGPVFGALTSAIGGAISQVQELVGTIASLVKVANPAVWKQFNFAMQDISGVLGQFLIPVLQAITEIVQDVGDELASMNAFREILKDVGDVIRWVWSVIGPVIKDTFRWINTIVQVFLSLFNAVSDLTSIMNPFGTSLLPLLAQGFLFLSDCLRTLVLGVAFAVEEIAKLANPKNILKYALNPGQFIADASKRWDEMTGKHSARGAAAGNASFVGLEDISKNAQQQAFAQSFGGLSDAQKAQNQRDETNAQLKDIKGFLDKLSQEIRGLKYPH